MWFWKPLAQEGVLDLVSLDENTERKCVRKGDPRQGLALPKSWHQTEEEEEIEVAREEGQDTGGTTGQRRASDGEGSCTKEDMAGCYQVHTELWRCASSTAFSPVIGDHMALEIAVVLQIFILSLLNSHSFGMTLRNWHPTFLVRQPISAMIFLVSGMHPKLPR